RRKRSRSRSNPPRPGRERSRSSRSPCPRSDRQARSSARGPQPWRSWCVCCAWKQKFCEQRPRGPRAAGRRVAEGVARGGDRRPAARRRAEWQRGRADSGGGPGADRVITLTNAAFGMYAPEGYARAIAERVTGGGYGAVVFAASATGKDLAPRVAARLGRPLAQDITDLAVDGGAVTLTRPVYAGKALLRLRVVGTPAVISLRPNVFTPVERPKAGTQESAAVAGPAGRVVVKEIKAAEAGMLDVAEAPIVVSGGRGLKEPA